MRLAVNKRGCSTLEFDTKPIVADFAHQSVIKIFQVIRAAGNLERFVFARTADGDWLGFGNGIVRLQFQQHAARGLARRQRLHRERHTCGAALRPRSVFRERVYLLNGAGFAPARQVEDWVLVGDDGGTQRLLAGFGSAPRHMEVAVESVQNFAVPSPFDGNPGIRRQFGGLRNPGAHFKRRSRGDRDVLNGVTRQGKCARLRKKARGG